MLPTVLVETFVSVTLLVGAVMSSEKPNTEVVDTVLPPATLTEVKAEIVVFVVVSWS